MRNIESDSGNIKPQELRKQPLRFPINDRQALHGSSDICILVYIIILARQIAGFKMLKSINSNDTTVNVDDVLYEPSDFKAIMFDGPFSWLPPTHPSLSTFDPHKFSHHRTKVDQPTLVIRGLTPRNGQTVNNLGGILVRSSSGFSFVDSLIPMESANNDCAIIDTCSLVLKIDDYMRIMPDLFGDEDVLSSISNDFSKMVGIKIGDPMGAKNFYHNTRKLMYTKNENGEQLSTMLGFVAWGGNNSTVQLYFNAEGCEYIHSQGFGWNKIKSWGKFINASLRRVDLAYDDMDGSTYRVRQVNEDRKEGLYNNANGGRMPGFSQVGDWLNDDVDNKGLTAYVGSRSSARYYRIYEKGKQLGDENSAWVRVELELKASNFYIPWDTLTEPGKYLAGSCKALEFISDERIKLVNIQKKKAQITLDSMISHCKRQYGKLINALTEIGRSAEDIINDITRDGIPKSLEFPISGKMPDEKISRYEFENPDWLSYS